MLTIKNLYNFFKNIFKSLIIFDKVNLMIIYERFIIIALTSFILISLIINGCAPLVIFRLFVILFIILHVLHGFDIIFDDYIKNKYANNIFKISFIILWVSLLIA